MRDDPEGGAMTIKEFLEKLERDEELLGLFRDNPAAACEREGLNERQCAVVTSGNLQKIRHAIELESGPTRGLHLRVIM